MAPKWIYVQAQARVRGQAQARNEPMHLPQIAKVVADIKGIDLEDLALCSSQNVRRVLPRMSEPEKKSNLDQT
jgi:TatD DNase family protein